MLNGKLARLLLPVIGFSLLTMTSMSYAVGPSPTPRWTAPTGKTPPLAGTESKPTTEPSPSASSDNVQNIVVATDQDQALLDQTQANLQGVTTVRTRVLSMRGVSSAATSTKSTPVLNLINHGGPLLSQVKIYPIWWGPVNQWPANYQSNVISALNGMSCAGSTCTQTTGLLNQYFPANAKASITIGTQYTDTSIPPSNTPSTSTMLREVNNLVGNSHLDAKGLYLVFTSNFPRWASYCAWHSAGSVANKWFTFGYMPNLTGVSGCAVNWFTNYPQASLSTHTLGADSEVNILTHEIYETMTDPMLNNQWGWVDASYDEIGDKCIWLSKAASTQLVLSNNTTWTVQTEWSNLTSGCSAN